MVRTKTTAKKSSAKKTTAKKTKTAKAKTAKKSSAKKSSKKSSSKKSSAKKSSKKSSAKTSSAKKSSAKKSSAKTATEQMPTSTGNDVDDPAAREFALVVERGAAAASTTFARYAERDAHWDPKDAPADAPWSFASNDAGAVIDQVFAPLVGRADGFIRALKAACRRVILRRDDEGQFHLLYFLDRDHPQAQNQSDPSGHVRFATVSGAAPARELPAGLPDEIRRFLAVHNGFGAAGYAVDAILPAAGIRPLPARPDTSEVYCDEVGNRIVLLTNSKLADWDHETGELADAMSFFAWLSKPYAARLLDLDPWEFRDGPRW